MMEELFQCVICSTKFRNARDLAEHACPAPCGREAGMTDLLELAAKCELAAIRAAREAPHNDVHAKRAANLFCIAAALKARASDLKGME